MTYVIAEIGQNHQGSVPLARALIDMAADPRAHDLRADERYAVDAVKFTLRDLDHEGTQQYMSRPYLSEHSFGPTYREHRDALELTDEEIAKLCFHAQKRGVGFGVTICHPNRLDVLDYIEPAFLKIASRDLTNIPLLEAVADTGQHIIISTGMADGTDLKDAVTVLRNCDLTIMHCLSQYPAQFKNLNLRTITHLKDQYPQYRIGYSDHSEGIVAPVAAVALGAQVIEKHVTLDRTMKGSDQRGSLERDGLWRMMRDIRNTEAALGEQVFFRHTACEDARIKLERSLATSAQLPAGTVITETDIELLSPGGGYKWRDRHKVIGRATSQPLEYQATITPEAIGE